MSEMVILVTTPDQPLNLSNEDILSVYLDSILMITTATTGLATDDDIELSAGAIAGIVIATIVVVICVVVVVIAVGRYYRHFCWFHLRHKKSSSL